MVRATRALALLRGRDYALPQDVQDIAPDILRHRLVLSYDALADDIPADHIVHRVMQTVPLPPVAPRQRAAGGPYGRRAAPARRPADPGRAAAGAARPAASDGPGAERARDRTVRGGRPAGPGGGLRDAEPAEAAAVLARLQLIISRKLDGLLQGDYLGLLPGPGSEAGESREYRPGDDVRRMDWPVTARTTVPHVRQTVADRELETWLAVDLSASLDFGTARCLKRDLVVAAAAAMAHLTVRGGNRIGAVVGTGERAAPASRPSPAGCTPPALLRKLAARRRARPERGRRGDLAAALEALRPPAAPARAGRGDLRLPGDRRAVGAAAAQAAPSATTCSPIEVVDPRELELPDVGVLAAGRPGDRRAARGADRRRELRRAVREAAAAAAGRDRRRAARGRRRPPAAAYRPRLAARYRAVRRRAAARRVRRSAR